jgi:hypothetical protein
MDMYMSKCQNKNKARERKVKPPKLQETFPFCMMQIHYNMLIWKENIKLQKQNVRVWAGFK